MSKKISLLMVLLMILSYSCTKDNLYVKVKLIGYAQKGPFMVGASVSLNELNSNLTQTGKSFSTQIIDNLGAYEINDINLSSSFVEFSADGYYYDEVKGQPTSAQLNLFAISNISNISQVNINVLTHLERLRIKYLVNKGQRFSVAKATAQSEILNQFGFNCSSTANSETLDITLNNDANAILLAVSIILQGNSNRDLTELLANIANDIETDGVLDNAIMLDSLRNSTIKLNLPNIRSNLEKYYQDLGYNGTIPEFEKYIEDFLSYTGKEPIVSVSLETNTTTSSITLNGLVNPNSLSTTVSFEYGTTSNYDKVIDAIQSPINGASSIEVSTNITGLSSGTIYYYRIKAINSQGTVYSIPMRFSTLGQVPLVSTEAAKNITTTSCKLRGMIYASNLPTTVYFEYGNTTNYTDTISAAQSPLTSTIDTYVDIDISNLSPATTYHFRVRAENVLGSAYGNDLTFTTYPTTVTDIEGNTYKVTVIMGSYVWMAENLRTTKFNDGTEIALITDNTTWSNLNTPGYCWYNNDESTYKTPYGILYNWYSVNSGKLCPIGWHVPVATDWTWLAQMLGTSSVAGGKLKESGTDHWYAPNTGATNETAFTALPGGSRWRTGSFSDIGTTGKFWSSTQTNSNWAYEFSLYYNSIGSSGRYDADKTIGNSVRCLRDF